MKKALIFALLFALATTSTHAQVSSSDLTATAGTAVETPSPTPEAPLTLTARKTKTEADLRALESQFRLFVIRTQLTIDRLATKDIDTTSAQSELTASLAALNAAKTDLDLLTTIIITDDMDEKTLEKTGLKPTILNIQDSLKLARTHLIQSLSVLKSSVTLTITQ